MRILVVSWGDFERWKEIRYRFGDETSVGPSTLPILQKVLRPDWTVIILPDTLGRDFGSVEALREDVRNRVMDFLERIGAGREVDIVIVPGIGEFAHGTFRGSAMDAYHYLLHRLSEIIPPQRDLDVHFDSTHGLNYITLLAYRALKELLGISAITNEVTFTVYNSDPLVPKVSRELTINTIEKTRVSPGPLNRPCPGASELLRPAEIEGSRLATMERNYGIPEGVHKIKPWLDAWIGSVFFGLPLVFLEEFNDVNSLEELIEKTVALWSSGIEVAPRKVTRRIGFNGGFSTIVKAAFQMKVLDRFRKVAPFTLEDLYDVSSGIFRGSTRARINTEIGKIEDEAIAYMERGETTDWIPLREFLNYSRANVQIKPRNFLAHAGFEANVTEVKIDRVSKNPAKDAKKHTYLRYSEDKKNRIRSIISKALREV